MAWIATTKPSHARTGTPARATAETTALAKSAAYLITLLRTDHSRSCLPATNFAASKQFLCAKSRSLKSVTHPARFVAGDQLGFAAARIQSGPPAAAWMGMPGGLRSPTLVFLCRLAPDAKRSNKVYQMLTGGLVDQRLGTPDALRARTLYT